jgi:dihydroneopterin aldolase
MRDAILVRGIRAFGRHGVGEEERLHAQPLDVDVELLLDLTEAAASDDLTRTVDYAELHRRVVEFVARTSFRLLERLAAQLALDLLGEHRIAEVTVKIAKPNLLAGATPAVRLRRARADL